VQVLSPQLLCLGVLLSVALPGAAGADEPGSFTLDWQAPAGCPAGEAVQAEVSRLLGGKIQVAQGRDIQARAVATHAQTWSVAIETTLAGRPGQRSIEAASCPDLANATALIIALMIDPEAVASHAAPAPQPAEPAPAPTQKSREVEFLAGLHGAGSTGTLPAFDAGLGGGIGLTGRHWRLELRGTYGLRRDQKAVAAEIPNAYGRFNFIAATLAGCFNLGRSLAYGFCADAEVGRVSAKGFGGSRGLPAQTLWLALGAGVYAALPLRPYLSLPVHLDMLAPLQRNEFVFKDGPGNVTGRVFKAPVLGLRITLGIELHF
jgi:hypothetical protein